MAINSLSASSYGLSGLVSGIDTQSMVEKMLSGTQSKIDSKNQQKSVLQMKQQLYRDVANQLKALQSSFLSFASGTNLNSSSFYSNMNAVLGLATGANAAFSVTATSNAKAGTYTMNSISQLATARTYRTSQSASGDVKLNLDETEAQRLLESYQGADASMYIKVGNEDGGYKEIFIGSAPETFAGMAPSDVAALINERLQQAGVKATASFTNNKLQIKAENADDYVTITGNTSASAKDSGLAMLMFGSGNINLSGKGGVSAAIDTDNYMPGFDVNLDGRTQTIRIGFDSLTALASGDSSVLKADLETQLRNAFGTGVKLDTTGSQWKLVSGSSSQTFKVTGENEVLDVLGMTSGVSNKLNTTMQLRDLNLSGDLQGNKHTFTINGVQFSYDSSATISNILGDINASKAGVKISYLESEDRFVIQNSETGAGTRELEIDQQEGNLLSVLFGVGGGKSATGFSVQTDMVSGEITADVAKEFVNGGVFSFSMNGNTHKFTVKAKTGQQLTAEKLAESLNEAFADTFGVKNDGTQNIEFLYEGGKFVVRSNDKDYNISAVAKNSTSNTSQLGFSTGQSTKAASGDLSLAAAGIDFGTGGGITINVGGTITTLSASDLAGVTTLNELAAKLDAELGSAGTVSFDSATGAFRLTASDGTTPISITMNEGAGSEGLSRVFGQDGLAVNQAGTISSFNDLMTDEGKNAIFKLNGNTYERASNNFTIDGITYNLTSTTYKDGVDVDALRAAYEASNGTRDDARDAYIALKGDRDRVLADYVALKGDRDQVGTRYVNDNGTRDAVTTRYETANGTRDAVTTRYETDNGTRDQVTTDYVDAKGPREKVLADHVDQYGTRDDLLTRLTNEGKTQEEIDHALLVYDNTLATGYKVYDDGLAADLKAYDDGLKADLKAYDDGLAADLNAYDKGLADAYKVYDKGLEDAYTVYDNGLNDALRAYDDGLFAALAGTSNHNSTTITVTRDTEKIVEGITAFVEKYNETMNLIYGLLKADATYKDYAPLTTEQKKEMSEKEIELWEEKSKEGLLRNDNYLQKIVASMRSIMYSRPEGSSIALYDLGITTSQYYNTNDGNLNIGSADNLRAMIESDPEAIMKLFAGDNGIMSQLDNAITEATSGSFSRPGYLTQVAGSSSLDTTSTIYKQLKDLDEQLIGLENKYWAEYNRYWKQFNSMEQMIQQMNTQVSWLSQLG